LKDHPTMIEKLVINLGRIIISFFNIYIQLVLFLFKVGREINFSLINRLNFRILLRELYNNTVKNFLYVVFSGFIVGGFLINVILNILTNLNSYDRIGEFIVKSIFHLLSPFIVSIILLMRSAIRSMLEVAYLKNNQELNTYLFFDAIPEGSLFLPKILSFSISALILNFYFILFSLLGGYILLGFLHHITYENYIIQIVNYVGLFDIIRTSLKVVIISFFMALLSVKNGLYIYSLEINAIMKHIVNLSLITIFTFFLVMNFI